MEKNKYSYIVIENAPDVCEGIIKRVIPFTEWQSLGYCVGIKEAIEKITQVKPNLIFLDWALNGGSAFELLDVIQCIPFYNPYIIFNTGFQKDNPEIPQEIINNYKIDKYLVKPLWENLRINLPQYLNEAAQKATKPNRKENEIWVKDSSGHKLLIDLKKISCINQNPYKQRSRDIYLQNKQQPITIILSWQQCYDLLQANGINFFITKYRSHLVVKEYIEKFEKPFVRIKGLSIFKVEVVKESLKQFEEWLVEK